MLGKISRILAARDVEADADAVDLLNVENVKPSMVKQPEGEGMI